MIKHIIKELEQAMDAIGSAAEELKMVTDEEQEAFDNMPESIQESDRGRSMEEGIESLEEQISALEDDIDLESIITALEELL